jgi:signal transduction histidine kinase
VQRGQLIGGRIAVSPALRAVLEAGSVVPIDIDGDIRYSFQCADTTRALVAPMRYRYGKILEGMIVAESRSQRSFSVFEREGLRLMGSQLAVHAARTGTLAENYMGFVHHFRRPMIVLRQFLRQCDRLAEARTLPTEVEDAVDVATGLSEHFRAYEDAFSGAHEPEREHIQLGALVDRAKSAARHEAKGTTIETEFLVGCVTMTVNVDAGAMSGALLELIYNAIKHDRSQRPVRVRCMPCERGCRIEVWDNGAPISAERAEYLFDLRCPIGGSGQVEPSLGLWIAATVVGRHEGEIALEWPDKTPKAFVVTLPAADATDVSP